MKVIFSNSHLQMVSCQARALHCPVSAPFVLLLRNLSQVTISGKPYYLLYIYICIYTRYGNLISGP